MGASAAMTPRWEHSGWTEEASAWIESHVDVLGPLRQKKSKPWSFVGAVTTPNGIVWFKELAAALSSEAGITATLSQQVPGRVAEVLATEGVRLLSRDAGRRMDMLVRKNGGAAAAAWDDMAAGYAELQIALVPIAENLALLDGRPETLAGQFREVEPLVDQLGATVPYSIVHLDVSPKNVCFGDGGAVFLDWLCPAVGHPFSGLVKPLRTLVIQFGAAPGGREVQRVRDAYLEPWSRFAPMPELRRVFAAAYPLGALSRAIRWQRMLEAVPSETREQYATRPNVWLQSFADSLRDPDRLGL